MSERTFRAVVAAVLVGALALAALVVAMLLPGPTRPSPSPSISTGSPFRSAPNPTATRSPGPALATPDAIGVGPIARGAASATTLVLRFLESGPDAIPDAPGSFVVTIVDQAGDGSSLLFYGNPSIVAPGSLGATALLVAPNELKVSIAGADTANQELITISGLGIRVRPTAALGPISATLGRYTGSFAGGAARATFDTLASVVASP